MGLENGKSETHSTMKGSDCMEDFFQFSVFDVKKQPFKIDKPVRLIELFAGIGSQAKALERLGVDFEHYRVCEFDKYAIKSYNAVHGTDFVTSDITQITASDLGIVNTDKYCYIMTYSFPCQDLSLAGKQKGMAKGENTRSGLLWEVERLLNECSELPQVLLMENVTQVHGQKNVEHFDEWIKFLESKGYSNYWKDLNAKNFGIPQNRNRTFMVSVLGDYTYEFPKEFLLELRLKDMLEDSVDEKFYISNERVDKIVNSEFAQEKTRIQTADVCSTLLARDYKDPKCIEVEPKRLGGLYDDETRKHQAGAIWDKETVSPTIDTMQGGHRQPLAMDEPQINVVGNYSPSNHDASRIVDTNGLAPTVKENHGTVTAVAERFFKQALKTLEENDCSIGDTVDAFNKRVNTSGISPTVTSRPEGFKTAILPVVVGKTDDHQKGEVYDTNYIGRTITATDYTQPMQIVEPLAYDEQNGYIRKDGTVGTLTTDGSSPKHNNRVIENCYVSEKGVRYICDPSRGMATDVNADVSQPLTAKGQSNWTGSFISPDIESFEKSSTIGSTEPTKINLKDGSQITSNDSLSGLRIRKLTPKECWRLMGFDDADFDKAAQLNSNSQLYKQAGNSIVVDVLYYIFRQMFI